MFIVTSVNSKEKKEKKRGLESMLSIWILQLLLKCMPLFSRLRCRLADFIFQLCSLVSVHRTMSFNKPRETEPHNFDLQVHLDIIPLLCSSCLFLVLWITKLCLTTENFVEQRILVNFNILFLYSPCLRICPLTKWGEKGYKNGSSY